MLHGIEADRAAPDGVAHGGRHIVDLERLHQAIALGEEVAGDLTALRTLLPEVASGKGRYFYVGTGLARAERNPKQLWSTIERDEVDPGFGTTG